MSKKKSRLTKVYIVGHGHNGSTILDIMLGNIDDVESVGELLSGMGRLGGKCSCGEEIRDCPFWAKEGIIAFCELT